MSTTAMLFLDLCRAGFKLNWLHKPTNTNSPVTWKQAILRLIMGKIVAIGGGDLRTLQTLDIDREIVELSGKERPKALFIPTASSDSVEYWEAFDRAYGGELGCDTDVLYMLGKRPPQERLQDAVLGADVIYVGGGNTLKMMRRWRLLGVDKLLETAYVGGTVLAGLSAGCICWFSYGHSDSMSFYTEDDDWSYIRVKGMGFIDAFGCPHYNGETRQSDFQAMMRDRPGIGIGIGVEDCCALEVVDGSYRIITSHEDAAAYRIERSRGGLLVDQIPQSRAFAPLADLLH